MAAMNRKAGNDAGAGESDAAKNGSLFVFASFRWIRSAALHMPDDAARSILRQRPESDQTKQRGRGTAKRNVNCGDASRRQQRHQRSDDLVSGRVRNVLEHEQRADEIEHPGTCQLAEPDVCHIVQTGLFRIPPRVLENRRRDVAGDDASRASSQRQRQPPGAASEIEYAIERDVAAEERRDRWKKRRDITFAGIEERGGRRCVARHFGRAVVIEKREIRLAAREIFPVVHDGSVRATNGMAASATQYFLLDPIENDSPVFAFDLAREHRRNPAVNLDRPSRVHVFVRLVQTLRHHTKIVARDIPYAIARARDPCGRNFHATYGRASCRNALFLNA